LYAKTNYPYIIIRVSAFLQEVTKIGRRYFVILKRVD